MNTQKQKCKLIKSLLQSLSGIEDIGFRSRKRPYPEVKKIYCKLCKKFTTASLSVIGEVLGNYDHATALHAINSFDDLYDTNGLDHSELYEEAKERLQEEMNALSELESSGKEIPETIFELHQKHLISLIKIIEKGHSIINKRQEQIHNLKELVERAFEALDPKKEIDNEELFSLRTEIKRTLLK